MYSQNVYVLVQYPKQAVPRVVYSQPADGDRNQLWADTTNLLSAKLMESKKDAPLITVWGPQGTFPEAFMAHRWKSSPPGLDVFHFGNLGMV